MGNGNNTITAKGNRNGISNDRGSSFSLENGNNTITAKGNRYGIVNGFEDAFTDGLTSTIRLGDGNNVIKAEGGISGIFNNGLIQAGAGTDIFDALTGGFSGTGTIDLGDGNDILRGHGSGNFFGGAGTDTLIFAEGTYTIREFDEDTFSIRLGSRTGFYNSFELIGSTSGELLDLKAGTLVVTTEGASYS